MAKTVTGTEVIDEAQKFLGDPYVYGAAGPTSFDCSGFVQYVFKQLGITTPRTSETQYTWGGTEAITRNQLRPGDLVFYNGASPGHVGFYAGGGKVLHAPHTGTVVKYEPIDQIGTITGYRRVTNVQAGASDVGWTNIPGDIVGGIEGGAKDLLGGALSIPGDIVDFFKDATTAVEGSVHFFTLLFQPTTYVRLASGFFGLFFMIAAAIFLIREASRG